MWLSAIGYTGKLRSDERTEMSFFWHGVMCVRWSQKPQKVRFFTFSFFVSTCTGRAETSEVNRVMLVSFCRAHQVLLQG